MSGPEEIALAVARLRAGGVVAFPTETVYGLGAPALDEAAVARVFALKGRPANNPLIVHVSGVEMARGVVARWPADADRLARAFWPGPLTLVMPRADRVPPAVTAGGPNVAVRCPDHPLTLALIEAFGQPLVGPSANLSGRVSPTTAGHVRESFSPEDVLVLDGGPCRAGIESTVLSLSGPARVLRPGVIGAAEIAAALGRDVAGPDGGSVPVAEGPGAPAMDSPGLMASHYAPRTRTVLVDAAGLDRLLAAGKPTVVAVTTRDLHVALPHRAQHLPGDARGYAAGLYAALRRADAAGAELIAVERPDAGDGPDAHVWRAVLDRLERATAE